MMTLKEKNEVLWSALMSIDRINGRFFRDAVGASEAEKYDRGKTAFDQIAKVIANVMRLDFFGDEPPKKSCIASEIGRRAKIPVISMQGYAAVAFKHHDPELPRLTAHIASDESGEMQNFEIFTDDDVLANGTVYAGKGYAVKMVRGALKGAMSRLGRHRRLTANRRAREAAATNNHVNPVNPV